jgi:hypothetical protein
MLNRLESGGVSTRPQGNQRQSAIFGEAKRIAEDRSLPTHLFGTKQTTDSPVFGNSVRGTERKRKQLSKRRWS